MFGDALKFKKGLAIPPAASPYESFYRIQGSRKGGNTEAWKDQGRDGEIELEIEFEAKKR